LNVSTRGSGRDRGRFSGLLDPFNILALIALIGLVALSLVGQGNAQFYGGGEFYERQTVWVIVGGVVFVLLLFFDVRVLERGSYVFLGVVVVLLALTLIVGTEANNSKRWIRFGAVNLQASEFAKLAVTLALARYLHKRKERAPGESEPRHVGPYGVRDLFLPLAIILAPAPFILFQPDLGTTLMILFIGGTMLAIEGVRRRALVTMLVSLLVIVPVAWKLDLIRFYQKERVLKLIDDGWEKLDPDTGAILTNALTQSEQAVIAIGNGGLTGQGHRLANPARMKGLPEIHTDFISAMFGEEFGFIGFVLMLILFWWLTVWALRTAVDARDRFSRLFCVGIASLLGWQVFVNIGMVAGVLPVVGLPLPLLSYGGSAMLMNLAALGIVFSVALRRGRR
jgi:rod shape determining protein RodA